VTRSRLSRPAALRVALGTLASAVVFWLILRFIGRGGAGPPLATWRFGWALAAVVSTTLQIAVVALRWAFFARELGAELGYPAALGAYYVSVFLNQLLPLGMLGDAVRGLWHARLLAAGGAPGRSSQPVLDAATALILDRASGQIALLALALAVLPLWWEPVRGALRGASSTPSPFTLSCALFVVAVLAAALAYFWRSALRHTRRARRLFFRPSTLAVHGLCSLVALFLHAAAFACAARALGFGLSLELAARVVPLVLLASTLPSFAFGTGAREATAAALYGLLGLHATEGAAIALGLGMLGFVASLPGLFVLALGRRRLLPSP
jgi:uncharacterized membrane protein YbhN (UPF0104 family)